MNIQTIRNDRGKPIPIDLDAPTVPIDHEAQARLAVFMAAAEREVGERAAQRRKLR